jgi:hypothetical protein
MSITIPPAALEAAARAIAESLRTARLTTEAQDGYKPEARAAFLAMLEAWEGAKTIRDDGRRQTYAIPALILPLPQEASDE